MSGTLNETSVSFAAASTSAFEPDGLYGFVISAFGEASLTEAGPKAGDWEHPTTSNTDRLARNRSFMATYPFKVQKQNTTKVSIGWRAVRGK